MRTFEYKALFIETKTIYDVEQLDLVERKAFVSNDVFDLWVNFEEIMLIPYTGKEDINGKKIFELDILESLIISEGKREKRLVPVSWDNHDERYVVTMKNKHGVFQYYPLRQFLNLHPSKVVGNLYTSKISIENLY